MKKVKVEDQQKIFVVIERLGSSYVKVSTAYGEQLAELIEAWQDLPITSGSPNYLPWRREIYTLKAAIALRDELNYIGLDDRKK